MVGGIFIFPGQMKGDSYSSLFGQLLTYQERCSAAMMEMMGSVVMDVTAVTKSDFIGEITKRVVSSKRQ